MWGRLARQGVPAVVLVLATSLLVWDLTGAEIPRAEVRHDPSAWWNFNPPERIDADFREVLAIQPVKSTWHHKYLALGVLDAAMDTALSRVRIVEPAEEVTLYTWGPRKQFYRPDEQVLARAGAEVRREDYDAIMPEAALATLAADGRLREYSWGVVLVTADGDSVESMRPRMRIRPHRPEVGEYYLMRDRVRERLFVVPAAIARAILAGEDL